MLSHIIAKHLRNRKGTSAFTKVFKLGSWLVPMVLYVCNDLGNKKGNLSVSIVFIFDRKGTFYRKDIFDPSKKIGEGDVRRYTEFRQRIAGSKIYIFNCPLIFI